MKYFRRLRRKLAKELPPTRPVRVIVGKMPDAEHDGLTIESGWCPESQAYTRWLIKIDEKGDETHRCEALYHEWAHVIRGIPSREPHDGKWGVAYAKCHRLWLAFLDEVGTDW